MVFKEVGIFAFGVMFVFVFLIFIGFIYELGKGELQWDVPKPRVPDYKEGVGVVEFEKESFDKKKIEQVI